MRNKGIRDMVLALIVAALITFFLQPVYMAGGTCDWRLLLLFIGIPFGVRRMFLWIVPLGCSIGTAAGIVVLDILVGGLIGIFVFAWIIVKGIVSLVSAAVAALAHAVRV